MRKDYYLKNRKYFLKKFKENYRKNRESRLIWQDNYYQKNKEKIIGKRRLSRLGTTINGKKKYFCGIIKRDYPKNNLCELCKIPKTRLEYHHWGKIKKGKKVKGIWVCRKCHLIITFMETKGLRFYQNYLLLKNKIGS